jgi:quercetin dioxygenase-like cupin family protein
MGDVVEIPPNTKHWHGATKDSWFTHIGITANPQKGPAEWFEEVNDQDYNKL